jgi:hypothetical protein
LLLDKVACGKYSTANCRQVFCDLASAQTHLLVEFQEQLFKSIGSDFRKKTYIICIIRYNSKTSLPKEIAMKLEQLMTLHADVRTITDIGACPFGTRFIADVSGGHFEGDRLRGTIQPSGGDWLLIDAEGIGHIDVRLTLETDDGALIYVQYYGVLVMNEQVKSALTQNGTTDYGDTYFMTNPRYETADKRYKWLNRIMSVAEGRLAPGAAEYQVFELMNG